MGRRIQERRSDRASADEVTELELQLWEFAKRPDPPAVPEAKLRPGAFLYRVHRVWHSLGRGSGIASHSFRALRDELLKRDPPVRNLQPKLYGTSPMSQSDASTLIDVMLETWHVARGKGPGWEAKALPRQTETETQPADDHDLDAIRENLLHTLFKGEDTLLLEEPVGVPPEIFMEERGRSSLALIIPTKSETTAHLSPANAFGGFSSLIGGFFDMAAKRQAKGEKVPLLIWVLRLGVVRDNAQFHQDFHCLTTYAASLTNWYLRLSRERGENREKAQAYWSLIMRHCAFAVFGLPKWLPVDDRDQRLKSGQEQPIDEDLAELDPNFFVPNPLPINLVSHRQIKRHRNQDFGLNVSIEPERGKGSSSNGRLAYWLFPESPADDLEETAGTTGLPVFNAEVSPGLDFDIAYNAIFDAASCYLKLSSDKQGQRSLNTLLQMGWRVFTIDQFQRVFVASEELGGM